MATIEQATETPARQLTREETLEHFDAQARKRLGMSGEEFVRRLDAGEFHDIVDDPINHPGYSYLAMLADDVRPFLTEG